MIEKYSPPDEDEEEEDCPHHSVVGVIASAARTFFRSSEGSVIPTSLMIDRLKNSMN